MLTPTEAAAVAVIYAVPVGAAVYRGLNLRTLFEAGKEAGTAVGAIMLMILFSMILSQMFTLESIPQRMVDAVFGLTQDRILILLLVNLVLFVVGMIVNDITAIILLAPLLMPLMKAIGVDPVHFAAIMGVNTALGGISGHAPGPVTGSGPMGTLTAGGMRFEAKNEGGPVHVLFNNGVKLIYDPKQSETDP